MEKNKLMMIIIIVLLVVLLGTILGFGIVLVTTVGNNNSTEVTDEVIEEEEVVLTPADLELVTLSEPITANLRTGADAEKHVAQISVSIGVDYTTEESQAFYDMLLTKEVIIQDIVLGILGSKTLEDMERPDAKEILKDEILQAVSEKFNTEYVSTVYIGGLYVD